MTNFSTSSDQAARAAPAKGTHYRFPGQRDESAARRDSLSEDFIATLEPWTDQTLASRGLTIEKSDFAVHKLHSGLSNRRQHKRQWASIRKTPGIRWKQAGFFDLGISLLILALSGSAVYLIEETRANGPITAQESTEITAARNVENEKLANAETDIRDLVRQ